MKKLICIILLLIIYCNCSNRKIPQNEVNFSQNTANEIIADDDTLLGNIRDQDVFLKKSSVYVTPIDGINLYSEPSIEGSIIKLLRYNKELIILERGEIFEKIGNEQNYWYKIDTRDWNWDNTIVKTGWVFGKYLALRPVPIITGNMEWKIDDINGVWVGDINWLNSPYISKREFSWGIGEILLDNSVSIDLGKKEVRINDNLYYIDSITKDEYGNICTEMFYINDKNKIYPKYLEITFLDYATTYIICYPQGEGWWYDPLSPDEKWVWYRLSGPNTAEKVETKNRVVEPYIFPINSTAYVAPSDSLNLRSEPGIKETRIRLLQQKTELLILEKGETLEIIDGQENYWYKVSIGNETGWVFGAYLLPYVMP